MQTFVLYSDPNAVVTAILTAEDLDNSRLGKQRSEVKQILQGSFPHHPATKMWTGHERALALYGHIICSEWIKRGFNDNTRPYFETVYHEYEGQVIEYVTGGGADNIPIDPWPWWFGHPDMVATHRDKLLRKLPNYYRQFTGGMNKWPGTQMVNPVMPYLWPNVDVEGEFKISQSELKRSGEWHVPDSWQVDHKTGIVTRVL